MAINGKFMGMDLFDQSRTLESVWDKLVRAYGMDAILHRDQAPAEFTPKGAQTLLEHLGDLTCQTYPSMGVGEDWRFQAPRRSCLPRRSRNGVTSFPIPFPSPFPDG